MKKIDVYGYAGCGYCEKVKHLLTSKSYHFAYHDVNASSAAKAELKHRAPNSHTVPQVFVGETHIGGYDEVLAAITRGHFQQIAGGS